MIQHLTIVSAKSERALYAEVKAKFGIGCKRPAVMLQYKLLIDL